MVAHGRLPAGEAVLSILDIPITLHASGDLDADAAWARYVDYDAWAGWAPHIVRVDADTSRIAPGATGRVTGPFGVGADFVVETVDELARTWSWRATVGPITVRLWHAVDPHGSGSTTTLRMRGPAPVVVGYTPLARWAIGRLVQP
ncbi:SRPBCC family protein [Jatrophihabitans sp. YIM 134969]